MRETENVPTAFWVGSGFCVGGMFFFIGGIIHNGYVVLGFSVAAILFGILELATAAENIRHPRKPGPALSQSIAPPPDS